MQLTRRHLRQLIREEYYNVSRQRRPLNEGLGIGTALAFSGAAMIASLGLAALSARASGYRKDYEAEVDAGRMSRSTQEMLSIMNFILDGYPESSEKVAKDVESGVKPEDAVKAELQQNSELADAIVSMSDIDIPSRPSDGIERHEHSGYPVDPEDDDYYERKYRHGFFGGMGDMRDM